MGATGKKMQGSKTLVQQIVKVESAMIKKGYVPFVHAMPASSKIVMGLYDELKGRKAFFKYFRNPFSNEIDSHEKMLQKVPNTGFQKKPHLLSMSYALTCNNSPLESAASWGFANHYGNETYFSMVDEIAKLNIHDSFKQKARALIREANRQPIGIFYVIGVPKQSLSRWVYDSLPYNLPTGRSVEDVIKNPTVADGGTIASLVISKETLDPDSGLVVVEANDQSEVEEFCKGMEFQNWDLFDKTFCFNESSEPGSGLKPKMGEFFSDFRSWQRSGKEPVYEIEECVAGDFPAPFP